MPYIKQELRDEIRHGKPPLDVGELNYCITRLIHSYWKRSECYQTANDILGAIEGAKAEFYRRKVAPYEEKKIAENGDL